MKPTTILIALLMLLSPSSAPPVRAELQTVARASKFEKTATYEQVLRLCNELAASSPIIQLDSMGRTAQGREIPLLLVGDPPEAPRSLDKMTHFVLGNIHAGEVCGKEAILDLAIDIANGQHRDLLDGCHLLLAPIFNADGNQPMSPNNRPAQHGPSGGVGRRSNAQGLDLNRDHIKLESPEVRSFVAALNRWDPTLVIDTHTTNGSYHRYALTYDGPRNAAAPANLVRWMQDDFLQKVGAQMESSGYLTFFYGNFDEDHRFWNSYPAWPRYGTQYVGVRGQVPVLSEAYAYVSYRDRILATKQFILSCLQQAVAESDTLRRQRHIARDEWRTGNATVTIKSQAAPLKQRFLTLGFDDATLPANAQPGSLPAVEQNYDVQFMGLEQPVIEVRRPVAYAIPAAWTRVIENLKRHGIQGKLLTTPEVHDVVGYRISKVQKASKPFQGHRLVTLDVEPEPKQRQTLPAETWMVSTAQDLGRLVVLLLEPESQDGLVTWNFFDEALEPGNLFPVLRVES